MQYFLKIVNQAKEQERKLKTAKYFTCQTLDIIVVISCKTL